MERDAKIFWDAVRAHWRPRDEVELHEVVRAVLHQLRGHLSRADGDQLFERLTAGVSALSVVPGRLEEERLGHRPGPFDVEELVDAVASAGDLRRTEARRAVEATFAGLKESLPPEERKHVRDILPKQLRALWRHVGD